MNQKELYQRLVDLYAGNELPQELKDELDSAALNDSELAWDMQTLATTVEQIRQIPIDVDVQASLQNVLNRLHEEGVPAPKQEPSIIYLQHYLPISG